jgi:hypothetical protein
MPEFTLFQRSLQVSMDGECYSLILLRRIMIAPIPNPHNPEAPMRAGIKEFSVS